MLRAMTCEVCGAKIREDRARCLRCGAALAAPAASSTERPLAIAIVAVVLAIGVVAAILIGRPAPRATGAGARVQTTEVVAAAAPAVTVPSTKAASMDASRGGIASYSRGDVAGSVEQFTAAVDADPRNADALNNLGQVLVRSGRAREAIPYFDRAIALARDVWAYHFNRARAYAELREWNRAIAGYRDAARIFPDDYATAFNLAKALQANGDLPGALVEFERAIALAPGEPDFHLAHAFALESASRPVDAVAAYRRYLELEDSPPQAEKIQARIAQLEAPTP